MAANTPGKPTCKAKCVLIGLSNSEMSSAAVFQISLCRVENHLADSFNLFGFLPGPRSYEWFPFQIYRSIDGHRTHPPFAQLADPTLVIIGFWPMNFQKI